MALKYDLFVYKKVQHSFLGFAIQENEIILIPWRDAKINN